MRWSRGVQGERSDAKQKRARSERARGARGARQRGTDTACPARAAIAACASRPYLHESREHAAAPGETAWAPPATPAPGRQGAIEAASCAERGSGCFCGPAGSRASCGRRRMKTAVCARSGDEGGEGKGEGRPDRRERRGRARRAARTCSCRACAAFEHACRGDRCARLLERDRTGAAASVVVGKRPERSLSLSSGSAREALAE